MPRKAKLISFHVQLPKSAHTNLKRLAKMVGKPLDETLRMAIAYSLTRTERCLLVKQAASRRASN